MRSVYKHLLIDSMSGAGLRISYLLRCLVQDNAATEAYVDASDLVVCWHSLDKPGESKEILKKFRKTLDRPGEDA